MLKPVSLYLMYESYIEGMEERKLLEKNFPVRMRNKNKYVSRNQRHKHND